MQVEASVELQETRKEFEGDLTLVVFPFVRAKKAPEMVANEIGEKLLESSAVTAFNVVKGFLNLSLDDSYVSDFELFVSSDRLGLPAPASKGKYIVEYSSNTNKPLLPHQEQPLGVFCKPDFESKRCRRG